MHGHDPIHRDVTGSVMNTQLEGNSGDADQAAIELTILMPCLDEAETIGICVDKARGFLALNRIHGEVLVADNGSTDGSVEIAEQHGARVVRVSLRGYGSALIRGIEASRGRYVIMGDADDSYDFTRLEPFIEKLRSGADLVIGNRFAGGIAPGAMPFLHRYFGNWVLSFIGRSFFSCPIADFHCGLRGFRRDAILALGLKMTGMEFASEMIVRASLAQLNIAEVPTTLSRAGRSRQPHLQTWRDGWSHLRLLLLLSPRWLFLYPGIVILLLGSVLSLALLPGPVSITPDITLDIHSLIIGCLAMLVGTECICFAHISRRYAVANGLLPPSPRFDRYGDFLTLERILLIAAFILLIGAVGIIYSITVWAAADFGPLRYGELLRVLTISSTFIALALQLMFTAFLASIFEL